MDDRTRAELKIAPDEDSPVTLLELDLTDLDAVDRIGPTIAQRFGKLDIVVGNAGLLGEMSPMHHIATDVWTEVVDVNLNANWRLIRSQTLVAPVRRRACCVRYVGGGKRETSILVPMPQPRPRWR